jgi:hypothetical protein
MRDEFSGRDLGLSLGQRLFLGRVVGGLENRHIGNWFVHRLTMT